MECGGTNLFVHTHKKGSLLALHVIGMDLVNQSICYTVYATILVFNNFIKYLAMYFTLSLLLLS